MRTLKIPPSLLFIAGIGALLMPALPVRSQSAPPAPAPSAPSAPSAQSAPIPDVPTLMQQVDDHQHALEKIRENYTYRSLTTTDDVDGHGKVTKTETEEDEVFYVNGHSIERTVKKNGQPLNDHDQQKEQERIAKLVEKAGKTPPDQPLQGPNESISIHQILDILQVSNPRREMFRGRSTILFDFAGRRDAKTHGMAEGAAKKIAGAIWIDEKDREVVRMEMHFTDNFHVAGGLLANIAKGSAFNFDQALVNGEIWLPTGAEGTIDARVLLVKGFHQHFTERDWDYKRFHVDAEQEKSVAVKPDGKS